MVSELVKPLSSSSCCLFLGPCFAFDLSVLSNPFQISIWFLWTLKMGPHSHSDEILRRERYFQSKAFHRNKNLSCNLIQCLPILSPQLWSSNAVSSSSSPGSVDTVDGWQMLLPDILGFWRSILTSSEKNGWRNLLHFCSTFKMSSLARD